MKSMRLELFIGLLCSIYERIGKASDGLGGWGCREVMQMDER